MRFRISTFIIGYILGVAATGNAVTLSEIMFDPDGNEATDEFIELYIDDRTAVDLRGWTITDGEGIDTLIGLEQGTFAMSGQYVLILDPDYFDDGSTTYDGRVPEYALVITINNEYFGSRGLSNSNAETWTVRDQSGNAVSSYRYTTGNRAGHSDEKILPDGGDDGANWADALVQHGTPGSRNSVTPPDRDLGITGFRAQPAVPQIGDSFAVQITVANTGRFPLAGGLQLFELISEHPDSTMQVEEWTISTLGYRDSARFEMRLIMRNGAGHIYRAQLTGVDDDSTNNSRLLMVGGSGIGGTVQFNEIMYMSEPQMPEWIEILNRAAGAQSLQDWRLTDGTGIADTTRGFRLPPIILQPGEYAILAADSAIYFMGLPAGVQVAVWNSAPVTLNNNGDSLLLYDAAGLVMDRLDYRPSWGGNVAGTSLERISPHTATNEPLNWASSLDSTGSTPGRMNSRALPADAHVISLLELAPNPFSPDGDGLDDILAIRFRLEHADSRIDVKIYDVRGRLVRQLAKNAPAAYTGELLWDGRADSGRHLPTGLYVIYLEALGKGGTRMQSARRVVALARRA